MASTTPSPAGDGYPDGPDRLDDPDGRDTRDTRDTQGGGSHTAHGATEDASPAWGEQLQASYEQGDSGGWGAPQQADTGPLRLGLGAHDEDMPTGSTAQGSDDVDARQPPPTSGPGSSARVPYGRSPEQPYDQSNEQPFEQSKEQRYEQSNEQPYGQSPYAQGTYPQGSYEYADHGQGPGQPAYEPSHGPGAFAASYDHGGYPLPPQGYPQSGPMPVTPRPSPEYGPGAYNPGSHGAGAYGPTPPRRPGRRDGLAAILDFSFARKATHAIAPVLFWLVVAWGVFQVLYVLVTMASTGSFGPGPGAIFLGVVAAIFDALLKIALARVFLELAVNVADMAERAQSGAAAR